MAYKWFAPPHTIQKARMDDRATRWQLRINLHELKQLIAEAEYQIAQ